MHLFKRFSESTPDEYYTVLVARDAHDDDAWEYFTAIYDNTEDEWICHFHGQREEGPGSYIRIVEKPHKNDRWIYISEITENPSAA